MLMELASRLGVGAVGTALDLLPILAIIAVFQGLFVRRPVPNFTRVLVGIVYVALGLTLFRVGVEESLIVIGRDMAVELVRRGFGPGVHTWESYLPIFMFAGLIGLTATLVEPTLIAAANRAHDLSGGSLNPLLLRFVISGGVAAGLIIGTLRIITGFPLPYLIAGITLLLAMLTLVAPRSIVPLALDGGGIATSVFTVPLIAAYGISVAEAMPNEATAIDGFGLIVLALLCPGVLLLGLALLQSRFMNRGVGEGRDAL
jgi:hypothetical protein